MPLIVFVYSVSFSFKDGRFKMTLKSTTDVTPIESTHADVSLASSVVVAQGVGRRRLLRAGLAATPVILAVSGRSAMASTACPTRNLSPLAWNSLTMGGTRAIPQNCSHTVTPSSGGFSPGGWKPQTSAGKIDPPWPSTCVPYAGYTSGQGCNSSTPFNTGTKFNQIFTGVSSSFATWSFSEIFLGSGSSTGSLEFHLCAAYLNAVTVPGYALTVAEVLNLAQRKIGTTTIAAGAGGDTILKDFIQQTYH